MDQDQKPATDKPAKPPSPWDICKGRLKADDRSWLPVSQAFHDEMLGAVPPIYSSPYWACGEPYDDNATGETIYLWFKSEPSPVCRLATKRELREEQPVKEAAELISAEARKIITDFMMNERTSPATAEAHADDLLDRLHAAGLGIVLLK